MNAILIIPPKFLAVFSKREKMRRHSFSQPIMKIVVTTPEKFLGNVTGDLSSRRGMIVHQDQRGTTVVVTAEAPLAEMFGYATALRGMSQGRASYAMEPLDYRIVPANIAKGVLEGE